VIRELTGATGAKGDTGDTGMLQGAPGAYRKPLVLKEIQR